MEKLILYARKSTDVEDKQVLSIETQLTELRKYARDNNLTIIDELVEKRTAKMPGRPVFNSLLARIKNGEATGILAWHPDRLARNSVDGGQIVFLVDQGLIKSLRFPTFWFEPTPQGKFMLNMAFGQSKYYVDSLSENTKRGLREKVRRGIFPALAPLGYLNDPRTKTIVVDKQFAPVIKQMYEAYASGRYTLQEISILLKEKGAVSRSGKLYSLDQVRVMLSNPFYYGLFRYKGELHEGSHEPIIEKSLFDKVQAVSEQRCRNKKKWKKNKVFCGTFRCSCGMMITAEYKVKVQKSGKRHYYTYYRCSRKSKIVKCKEKPIREELLDSRLSDFLLDFAPPTEMLDYLTNRLNTEAEISLSSTRKWRSEIEQKVQGIALKQKILLDSYLDQDIDRKTFVAKKNELLNKKKSLSELLGSENTSQNLWVEPMRKWLDTLGSICKIAKSDDLVAKKHLILDLFGLNLVLTNQTPILASYHNDKRAGENGPQDPRTLGPHFRLYSELRSAIKSAHEREDSDFIMVLEAPTGIEPVYAVLQTAA